MKQVFLVLLIAATSLSVSAQRNHRDNNSRIERYNKHDRFDERQKEEFRRQIARINHEYDAKIHSVKNMPLMRARVKARKINELEKQRRHELNVCRANFYKKMDYADRGRNYKRNKW
ncbi:MAG: hypothetical protein JNK79_08620 [Chitinophagaceae bacterium]|nr:hypothetical protein [Chitinophagaceae bacterium]